MSGTYLTSKQVAALLDCSICMANKAILRAGGRKLGGLYRIEESALRRYFGATAVELPAAIPPRKDQPFDHRISPALRRHGPVANRGNARRKRALRRRDGGMCFYCGKRKGTTIDHVMPVSRGGGNSLQNLVLACHECNQSKAAMLPDEARAAGALPEKRIWS